MAAGFRTTLDVRLVDHNAHSGRGEWMLLADLVFEDADGRVWTVPAGFRTDFASVPRVPIAFLLAGCTAHAPAALHDWACSTKPCPRSYADELFRQAMESVGMPPERVRIMYNAVRAYTERNDPPGPEGHGFELI
jgi:hypothetical protein